MLNQLESNIMQNKDQIILKSLLRTEVRGDFSIHGTKFFHNAVFHQKSKKFDVVSLPVFWPTKGTGGLKHHIFFISYGKQYPKIIWFHGC